MFSNFQNNKLKIVVVPKLFGAMEVSANDPKNNDPDCSILEFVSSSCSTQLVSLTEYNIVYYIKFWSSNQL